MMMLLLIHSSRSSNASGCAGGGTTRRSRSFVQIMKGIFIMPFTIPFHHDLLSKKINDWYHSFKARAHVKERLREYGNCKSISTFYFHTNQKKVFVVVFFVLRPKFFGEITMTGIRFAGLTEILILRN